MTAHVPGRLECGAVAGSPARRSAPRRRAPDFVLNLVFALSLVAAAGGGFVLGQMFQQMQMDARAYEAAQRV